MRWRDVSQAMVIMIQLKTSNDVLSLSVAAEQLNSVEAVSRFEQELRRLVRERPERFWLMDFGDRTFFVTPAINALLAVLRTLHERGGKLVLTGVSRDVRHILDLHRLSSILTISPNVAAGLSILGAAPDNQPGDTALAG